MARYIVTNGTYFNPMDYDTLMKPVQAMQERHDAAADAYDTLNLETEAIRQYITENPEDSQALQIYNDYSNKLQKLQNNLWENGVTTQTRRDLASARAAFGEVAKVKSAIQNRQTRSKEYWDARHKNPDLIMGADPGKAGLNNYLNNDLYGQDWYSYSGTQFMSEVGADAKARANELMRNPEYMKNPELAGYITRITQDGFTSAEVENASAIARNILDTGNTSALENAGLPETILASVLLSHLESTGARGNISDSEFNRLFDYGRAGLSQAIGKTDFKDLKDNAWELAAQKSLARYTQSLKNPKPNNNGTQQTSLPYTLNDLTRYMKSADSDKIGKILEDKFKSLKNNPVIVTTGDGTSSVISSPLDAKRILDSFGRETIMNNYGINPDAPEGTHKLSDGQGGEVPVRVRAHVGGMTGSNYNAIPLEGNPYLYETKNEKGEWVVDEDMTRRFNSDITTYRDAIKNFKQNNKGVNLQKLAISDKDRGKIYKDNNIPDYVPFEYVPDILETKMNSGYFTPATIAGSTKDMDSARQNYTRLIVSSFAREANNDGKVAKGSPFAFYPIDDFTISDKGKTSLEDVFGEKIDDNSVSEITVLPEDLLQNKVRITINGNEYAINSAMLGNDMMAQLNKLKSPVEYAMLPITNPEQAVMLSPEEEALWSYNASQILGDYFRLVNVENGSISSSIRPRDIVTNPKYRNELRHAITLFMNGVIADARDNMMLNNYRVRGNTSDKAAGYNDYLEE